MADLTYDIRDLTAASAEAAPTFLTWSGMPSAAAEILDAFAGVPER